MPLDESCGVHRHGIQHGPSQDEPLNREMIPFGGSFKGLVSERGSSRSCTVREPPAPTHHVKIFLFPTKNLGIRGPLLLGRFLFVLGFFFWVGFAGSRGWDHTGCCVWYPLKPPGEDENTWKAPRVISTPAETAGGGEKHKPGISGSSSNKFSAISPQNVTTQEHHFASARCEYKQGTPCTSLPPKSSSQTLWKAVGSLHEGVFKAVITISGSCFTAGLFSLHSKNVHNLFSINHCTAHSHQILSLSLRADFGFRVRFGGCGQKRVLHPSARREQIPRAAMISFSADG